MTQVIPSKETFRAEVSGAIEVGQEQYVISRMIQNMYTPPFLTTPESKEAEKFLGRLDLLAKAVERSKENPEITAEFVCQLLYNKKPKKGKIPGPKKAAALLIMLGPVLSNLVFTYLIDAEVDELTTEILRLEKLGPPVMEHILEEFLGYKPIDKALHSKEERVLAHLLRQIPIDIQKAARNGKNECYVPPAFADSGWNDGTPTPDQPGNLKGIQATLFAFCQEAGLNPTVEVIPDMIVQLRAPGEKTVHLPMYVIKISWD